MYSTMSSPFVTSPTMGPAMAPMGMTVSQPIMGAPVAQSFQAPMPQVAAPIMQSAPMMQAPMMQSAPMMQAPVMQAPVMQAPVMQQPMMAYAQPQQYYQPQGPQYSTQPPQFMTIPPQHLQSQTGYVGFAGPLKLTVGGIHGFSNNAGLMDKADPFVRSAPLLSPLSLSSWRRLRLDLLSLRPSLP